MENLFCWTIPNEKKALLHQLIGCKIVDMIKISYETYHDYLNYLDEIQENSYRDKVSFFKFHFGSLFVIFDNKVECSFSIADDLNSLIMICQKSIEGRIYNDYSLTDKTVLDKTSIFEIDKSCEISKMINQPVSKINILTLENLQGKLANVPSEMGLEFVFQNNERLSLSYNLSKNHLHFITCSKDDLVSNTKIKYSII
jgi:hypothetical protein